MSLWNVTKKTIIYYTFAAVFWTVLFNVVFDFKDVFISLDVFLFFNLRTDEIPRAILCTFCFIKEIASLDAFAGVILNVVRIKKRWEEIEKMGYSASYDGPQGIGKTRSLVYDAFVLKKSKYRNLRADAYLDAPIADDLKEDFDRGIQEKFIRFKSRLESVEEYKKHPEFLELIYSNFGIYENGKKARPLKKEHFTQQERIFESNIKVGAELDNLFPNVLRKTKKSAEDADRVNYIDEYVGLDRQYTDGVLLSDTHRTKSVFISFRDCMQVKYHLLEHKYLYTPKLLKRLYRVLEGSFFEDLDELFDENLKNGGSLEQFVEKSKKFAKRRKVIVTLQKYVRAIGFTKVFYLLETGAAGYSRPGKDTKIFVLPNDVPYYYDDRGMQKDYLPLGYRKEEEPEPKEKKKKGRPKKEESGTDRSADGATADESPKNDAQTT